jgi:hypothetical protein
MDPQSAMPRSAKDLVNGYAETWVMNADGSEQRVLIPHMYGEGRNPWRNDPVKAGDTTFMCKM